MAIVDYFLKIDGLPGESSDVQHKNEFEIKDFSFGIENPTTIGSATGGAGAGKVKFNEFTIKKTTDKASPIFFRNCAAGAHYKSVVLTARKAGGDPKNAGKDFLKLTLSDVLTSRYENAAQRTPPGSVVVISPPVDTVGGPIGGLGNSGPGDGTPEDGISFRYAKIQESVNATQIPVPPTAGGMLAFDPATNTFKVSDAPGGVFTVGSMAGVVSRAALEFDVAILIGLLTAPFSTATLGLTINGMPPGPGNQPPGPVNGFAALNVAPTTNTGPQPHLFDVILYTPADGALTVEDLTRPGRRIGTLTFLPDGTPVTLDIDLTDLVKRRHLDAFGIRIQLRGAPVPGLTDDKDESNDDRGDDTNDGEKDDDRKPTPPTNFVGSFTVNLVFDTA